MTSAYPLAALGSVFYGASDFLGGLASRKADAWAVTLFAGWGALAMLLLGAPFVHGVPRPADLAWAIAAGASGGIGAMLIYRALAIGPMSIASPVLCVVGIALPVLVGITLGDRATAIAMAGLLLAPLSIVLLARSGGAGGAAPGGRSRVIRASIAAGLAAGCFLVCFGQVRQGSGLWPFVLARLVGMVVLGAGTIARRAPLKLPPGTSRQALAAGALDSVANVVYVLAAQRGALSLVAALVSLSPATAVLLARVFLGERWSVPQRFGIAAALAAGVLISLG